MECGGSTTCKKTGMRGDPCKAGGPKRGGSTRCKRIHGDFQGLRPEGHLGREGELRSLRCSPLRQTVMVVAKRSSSSGRIGGSPSGFCRVEGGTGVRGGDGTRAMKLWPGVHLDECLMSCLPPFPPQSRADVHNNKCSQAATGGRRARGVRTQGTASTRLTGSVAAGRRQRESERACPLWRRGGRRQKGETWQGEGRRNRKGEKKGKTTSTGVQVFFTYASH